MGSLVLGGMELVAAFFFVCNVCTLYSSLFTHPHGADGKLCSMTVTFHGHFLYCFSLLR